MITRRQLIENVNLSWEQEYASSFRHPRDLLTYLGLSESELDDKIDAQSEFSMRIPLSFASRMQAGDANDPLLLQVLPLQSENIKATGFTQDPLMELDYQQSHGLIKKYHGRALVITTGSCAVHCRYCFRRHFPYESGSVTREEISTLKSHLEEMHDLEEVILSGGDPLSLSDSRLGALLESLSGIQQLQRVRIHTRLPVVLPSRVTEKLIQLIRNFRLPVICVVHVNHANEIDMLVSEAFKKLRDAGAVLFNQSVLLRNVNDNFAALATLSKRLIESGVTPYYLHQLDKVEGASHFALDDSSAISLHRQLAATLPGYLVPKLVRDMPGQHSKMPLCE